MFDRNGLEVLSRGACLDLLAGQSVGRVATTMAALPVVLPVNYGVLDEDVVFRTTVGTKLAAAVEGAVVAFEVDVVDRDRQLGWSVLVTGLASEVTDPDEVAAADRVLPDTWLPEEPRRVVRVRSELVTGRRIHPRAGEGAA